MLEGSIYTAENITINIKIETDKSINVTLSHHANNQPIIINLTWDDAGKTFQFQYEAKSKADHCDIKSLFKEYEITYSGVKLLLYQTGAVKLGSCQNQKVILTLFTSDKVSIFDRIALKGLNITAKKIAITNVKGLDAITIHERFVFNASDSVEIDGRICLNRKWTKATSGVGEINTPQLILTSNGCLVDPTQTQNANSNTDSGNWHLQIQAAQCQIEQHAEVRVNHLTVHASNASIIGEIHIGKLAEFQVSDSLMYFGKVMAGSCRINAGQLLLNKEAQVSAKTNLTLHAQSAKIYGKLHVDNYVELYFSNFFEWYGELNAAAGEVYTTKLIFGNQLQIKEFIKVVVTEAIQCKSNAQWNSRIFQINTDNHLDINSDWQITGACKLDCDGKFKIKPNCELHVNGNLVAHVKKFTHQGNCYISDSGTIFAIEKAIFHEGSHIRCEQLLDIAAESIDFRSNASSNKLKLHAEKLLDIAKTSQINAKVHLSCSSQDIHVKGQCHSDADIILSTTNKILLSDSSRLTAKNQFELNGAPEKKAQIHCDGILESGEELSISRFEQCHFKQAAQVSARSLSVSRVEKLKLHGVLEAQIMQLDQRRLDIDLCGKIVVACPRSNQHDKVNDKPPYLDLKANLIKSGGEIHVEGDAKLTVNDIYLEGSSDIYVKGNAKINNTHNAFLLGVIVIDGQFKSVTKKKLMIETRCEIKVGHRVKIKTKEAKIGGSITSKNKLNLFIKNTATMTISGTLKAIEVDIKTDNFWSAGSIRAENNIYIGANKLLILGVADTHSVINNFCGALRAKNISLVSSAFANVLCGIFAVNNFITASFVELGVGLTMAWNAARNRLIGLDFGINLPNPEYIMHIIRQFASGDTEQIKNALWTIFDPLKLVSTIISLLQLFLPEIGMAVGVLWNCILLAKRMPKIIENILEFKEKYASQNWYMRDLVPIIVEVSGALTQASSCVIGAYNAGSAIVKGGLTANIPTSKNALNTGLQIAGQFAPTHSTTSVVNVNGGLGLTGAANNTSVLSFNLSSSAQASISRNDTFVYGSYAGSDYAGIANFSGIRMDQSGQTHALALNIQVRTLNQSTSGQITAAQQANINADNLNQKGSIALNGAKVNIKETHNLSEQAVLKLVNSQYKAKQVQQAFMMSAEGMQELADQGALRQTNGRIELDNSFFEAEKMQLANPIETAGNVGIKADTLNLNANASIRDKEGATSHVHLEYKEGNLEGQIAPTRLSLEIIGRDNAYALTLLTADNIAPKESFRFITDQSLDINTPLNRDYSLELIAPEIAINRAISTRGGLFCYATKSNLTVNANLSATQSMRLMAANDIYTNHSNIQGGKQLIVGATHSVINHEGNYNANEIYVFGVEGEIKNSGGTIHANDFLAMYAKKQILNTGVTQQTNGNDFYTPGRVESGSGGIWLETEGKVINHGSIIHSQGRNYIFGKSGIENVACSYGEDSRCSTVQTWYDDAPAEISELVTSALVHSAQIISDHNENILLAENGKIISLGGEFIAKTGNKAYARDGILLNPLLTDNICHERHTSYGYLDREQICSYQQAFPTKLVTASGENYFVCLQGNVEGKGLQAEGKTFLFSENGQVILEDQELRKNIVHRSYARSPSDKITNDNNETIKLFSTRMEDKKTLLSVSLQNARLEQQQPLAPGSILNDFKKRYQPPRSMPNIRNLSLQSAALGLMGLVTILNRYRGLRSFSLFSRKPVEEQKLHQELIKKVIHGLQQAIGLGISQYHDYKINQLKLFVIKKKIEDKAKTMAILKEKNDLHFDIARLELINKITLKIQKLEIEMGRITNDQLRLSQHLHEDILNKLATIQDDEKKLEYIEQAVSTMKICNEGLPQDGNPWLACFSEKMLSIFEHETNKGKLKLILAQLQNNQKSHYSTDEILNLLTEEISVMSGEKITITEVDDDGNEKSGGALVPVNNDNKSGASSKNQALIKADDDKSKGILSKDTKSRSADVHGDAQAGMDLTGTLATAGSNAYAAHKHAQATEIKAKAIIHDSDNKVKIAQLDLDKTKESLILKKEEIDKKHLVDMANVGVSKDKVANEKTQITGELEIKKKQAESDAKRDLLVVQHERTLAEKDREISKLADEKESLKAKLKEQEDKNKALEEKNRLQKEKIAKAKNLDKVEADYKRQLGEKDSEITRLRDEKAASEKRLKEKEEKIAKLKQQKSQNLQQSVGVTPYPAGMVSMPLPMPAPAQGYPSHMIPPATGYGPHNHAAQMTAPYNNSPGPQSFAPYFQQNGFGGFAHPASPSHAQINPNYYSPQQPGLAQVDPSSNGSLPISAKP